MQDWRASPPSSTPELATTLAAARMGAIDHALGHILGSSLFDLLIVPMDDIAYVPGSIFQGVSIAHVVCVLCAALMNVAVIVALLRRPQRVRWVHAGSHETMSSATEGKPERSGQGGAQSPAYNNLQPFGQSHPA